MADGLHQQKKNYASGRRGVVGHRPNQHKKTGSAQQQKQNRKTHLAVAHGKWQAGQEQQSAAPKIGAAASYQFFLRDSPNVRPSVLVILAFPAVIEILELLVVVMHGWFSVVPQEEQCVSGEPPIVIAHKHEGQNQNNSQGREHSSHSRSCNRGGCCFSRKPPEKPDTHGKGEK